MTARPPPPAFSLPERPGFGFAMAMRWRWGGLLVGLAWAMAVRSQHATNTLAAAAEQASKLPLAPGLRLSVWAAEPQLSNGVAFHLDPNGRVFVAESHRWARSVFDITQRTNWLLQDLAFRTVEDRVRHLEAEFAAVDPELLTRDSEVVRRVEDRDGDGRADHSEVVADGFNTPGDGTAAGVLATRDAIYFADIPNLWKLTPTSAGTVAREALATGFGVHVGVSGHDLHGLAMGPDGRLYVSMGDRGLHVTNREGRVMDLPDMGSVLRCEPDGSGLEVFCVGLRNPQELAFDDEGELWTVDNDTAGADPCRVLHLVRDGDYGWRCSYQHQDGFGPWVQEELWKGGKDNILPLAGTVSQGPSGLAFYPGTGLGDAWRGKFLHCDFPGGVWSFDVRPRGASFEVGRRDKFVWGCWPTDVDFGPDGSVYVLDWVAGWGQPMKGRIYRIQPSAERAPAEAAVVAEVRRLLSEGMGGRSPKELLGLLGHADRRVRMDAQFELARRGRASVRPLSMLARGPGSSLARRHALWALGQVLRREPDPAARAEPCDDVLPLLLDSDPVVQGAAAELAGDLGWVHADGLLARLATNASPRVRFKAAMALGSLQGAPLARNAESARRAVNLLSDRAATRDAAGLVNLGSGLRHGLESTTAMAVGADASDPFLMHAVVRHGLRFEKAQAAGGGAQAAPSPQLVARARHPSPSVRLAATWTLRGLRHPWLTNLVSDADARVASEACRAIHDVPVVEGYPALALLITRVDLAPPLHGRVIDAAARLGTSLHAQMLAAFAKRRDPPPASRAMALRALGDWGRPPVLDRVNGLWRPAFSSGRGESLAKTDLAADLGRSLTHADAMAARRGVESARRAFLKVADEILNPMTPDERGVVVLGGPAPALVQRALVDAAAGLRTKEAAQPLLEHFQSTNAPGEVRAAIVGFLAGLRALQAPEAIRLALASGDAGLRAAALPHLGLLEPDAALPALRGLLQTTNPVPVRQAALAALARIGTTDSDALLMPWVAQLGSGALNPELVLDVVSAARARKDANPAVGESLGRWMATVPATALRETLVLRGGDAVRGGALFRNHPQVQCLRCHKVAGDGGIVGPSLDGIGRKHDRAYLLQSITSPNAAYAEGYRPPEGGLSAMPEGLAELLTDGELRDVVEFLTSLK